MADAFDLSNAVIHNSPDVRLWPATATITELDFRADGVHVEHTKNLGAGAWPNFRPAGWDGDLQYTLWIFLNIEGQWHGSGCIEFWQSCDKNGGPPEEFAKNWYYAADRWAPMTGHQPAPGEQVGFMVSAGDARNNGIISVHERSNIVGMPFPSSGMTYRAAAEPPPVQPPAQPPVTTEPPPVVIPPVDTTLADAVAQLQAQCSALQTKSDAQETRLATLEARPAPVEESGWKGYAEVNLLGIKAKAPVTVTQRIP